MRTTYEEIDMLTDDELNAEFATEKDSRRAARRKMDYSKAQRKRNKANTWGFDWYDNLHQYSKNKIHCSCRMCRSRDYYGRHRLTIQEEKMNDEERFERNELNEPSAA